MNISEIQEREASYGVFKWIFHRDAQRAREYSVEYQCPPAEILSRLNFGVTKEEFLASAASDLRLGQPTLEGRVDGETFRARLYSPHDTHVQIGKTRVVAWGDVVEVPVGRGRMRLFLRPGLQPFIQWVVSVVLALSALTWGVSQFLPKHQYKYFATSLGITVLLLVVGSTFLWWGVHEGKGNEMELLDLLDETVKTPTPLGNWSNLDRS